jgi:argininosuccinate lyase
VKMWEGRSKAPLDPEFEQWQRSFPYDKRLLAYEAKASTAHARALRDAGVLNDAELLAIVGALAQIAAEGVPAGDRPEIEDVHHLVEVRMVELIGEAGYKLHTGRSRNEQIATDLRLFIREAIDSNIAALGGLADALVTQAEKAGEAAMPAYTHLRRAEPVLVAHWLLAYVEMFLRDAERLVDCRKRVNLCPLGSGAIAGTILPLDRTKLASELGFAAPTANSMDATSDRDFAIEYVQAVSILGVHLSRLAEEMIIFSTQEFAFVAVPDAYATGSSAMPQKLNPDALELLRGSAGRIFGNAMQLLTTVKGLPLAYNKDLQETQRPLLETSDYASHLLSVATGCTRRMKVDYAVTEAASASGAMNALAAAAWMVKRGVPFRRAHEAVGKAVRICVERGCEIQELSTDELKQCGIEADASFKSGLELGAVLDCHDVEGGTNRKRVCTALAQAKERVAALCGATHAHA